MKYLRNNLFIIFLLLVISFLILPDFVSAQSNLGLGSLESTNLGNRSIPELIVRIIQVALSLLGILALLVVLYGGYAWMTSGGSEEKVTTAKKILLNGVIGLIIILAALSIVTFLITKIYEATGGQLTYCTIGNTEACSPIGTCLREKLCSDQDNDGLGEWGSCYITNPQQCNLSGNLNEFYLEHHSPPADFDTHIANVAIQLTFNNNIGNFNEINLSQEQGVRITNRGTAELIQITGELSNPRKIVLRPQTNCSAYNHPELFCFPYDSNNDDNNWYTVEVLATPGASFIDNFDNQVTCDLSHPCTFDFKIGPLVDLEPPSVDLTEAFVGTNIDDYEFQYTWLTDNINVPITADLYIFKAHGSDDAALASFDFFEGLNNLGSFPVLNGQLEVDGYSTIPWSPNQLGYQLFTSYNIRSEVTDFAGNEAISEKQVTLYPPHCFNDEFDQDLNETGFDCGGECPACVGDECSSEALQCVPVNNICASNLCDPSTCLCVAGPVILGLDPDNGAPSNWVTIYGSGFGEETGTVYFIDTNNNPTQATLVSLLVCGDVWHDNYIIVEVPTGYTDGGEYKWQVKTSANLLSNYSPDFLLDSNAVYPGLCAVTPDSDIFESNFQLVGNQFNGTNRDVYFGESGQGISALGPITWTDNNNVLAYVPNLATGQSVVHVSVDQESSNGLYFNVLPQSQVSSISFSPQSGNVDQYVTIYGSNFGDIKGSGTVYFTSEVEGNFDFPLECGTNYWTDNQIIVKVPSGVIDGLIRVVTASGVTITSTDNFDFDNTLQISPGICSINPDNGERATLGQINSGTLVELVGEQFFNSEVNFTGINILNTDYILNTENIIKVYVPLNANTGQVRVINNGGQSNPVNFQVNQTTAGGQPTDEYYEWQFTTCEDCLIPEVLESGNCWSGENASPTPTPYGLTGGDSAFINQNIGLRFNINMDNSTLISNNIQIDNCGNGDQPYNENNCTLVNWTISTSNFTDTSPEYVILNPNIDLNANAWYRIILNTNIKSQDDGISLVENYSWYFKTAISDLQCSADTVNVEPFDRTGTLDSGNPIYLTQTVNYLAAGFNSANCAICEDNYIWGWTSSDNNKATIDQDSTTSQNLLTANGLVEDSDIATLTARITDKVPFPTGLATLNIIGDTSGGGGDLLSIIDYQPTGDNVCINALASINFNHSLDPSTITLNNFLVYWKNIGDPDYGTNSFAHSLSTNATNDIVYILPSTQDLFWDKEMTFMISVQGGNNGIESNGDQLILTGDGCGTNSYDSTENLCYWEFTTTDNICEVDHITIDPEETTLNVGEIVGWTANVYDDVNNELADHIQDWSTNKEEVVDITINDTNSHLATGEALSPGQATIYASINNISGLAGLTVAGDLIGPEIIEKIPEGQGPNNGGFCTNSLVQVTFDKYLNPETIANNFNIYQHSNDDLNGCQAITKAENNNVKLVNAFTDLFFNDFISNISTKFFNSLFTKAYATAVNVPNTGYWCPIDNFGTWSLDNIGSQARVRFLLNQALPSTGIFRVKINGTSNGVLGLNGLPLNINNDFDEYYFTTSDDLCQLNFLQVSTDLVSYLPEYTFTRSDDEISDNPPLVEGSANFQYDTIADYDKAYYVTGFSSNGQILTPIPDVYDWLWYWNSEDTSIALTTESVNYGEYYPDTYDRSYNIVLAANQDGETDITARAVFQDLSELTGTGKARVDICENPWPKVSDIIAINQSLAKRYYEDTDFYFGLSYCRDAGSYGVSDDLPDFPTIQTIESNNNDFADTVTRPFTSGNNIDPDDLLKEYLIPVEETEDVIGLRVYSNNHHLSPVEWYHLNIPIEQQGNLSNLIVNGYPAIQDGRTVYVAATDVNIDNEMYSEIYSDIYLISYNSKAEPVTINIYNQLIDRWQFNTNISEDDKDKLIRDLKRLNDLTYIQALLGQYHSKNNTYPVLSGGTFLAGMSTSKWPSWNETFGPVLNASLPVDPINMFNACADCTLDTDPNCDNYDLNTCWNEEANGGQGSFACDAGSYFYRYQYAYGQSPDYFLAAKMEFPYPTDNVNIWQPNFNDTHLELSTLNVSGCGPEVLGSFCGNGVVEGNESCESGQFLNLCGYDHQYNNPQFAGCVNCSWEMPNQINCDGWCGDDVLNGDEQCDGIDTTPGIICNPNCTLPPSCGDGIIQISLGEQCDESNLGNWGCTNQGNPSCDSSCQVSCDSGEAYQGTCGNNIREENEECDGMDRPPHTICSGSCTVSCDSNTDVSDQIVDYIYSACDNSMTDLDGCEVNLLSDEYNCNSCGNSCYSGLTDNNQYTLVECVQYLTNQGVSFAECSYGCNPYSTYLNCDYLPAGCESNYLTDVNNCGSCGYVCSSDNAEQPYPGGDNTVYLCENAECDFTCLNPQYQSCDDVFGCETDLYNDSENCGSCGYVCPVPDNGLPDNGLAVCLDGNCGIGCDDGYLVSNNQCVLACGNNIIDPGEECDPPELNNYTCDQYCQFITEGQIGCMDQGALNYNPDAIYPGQCQYPNGDCVGTNNRNCDDWFGSPDGCIDEPGNCETIHDQCEGDQFGCDYCIGTFDCSDLNQDQCFQVVDCFWHEI